MTREADLLGILRPYLERYRSSFAEKIYSDENNEHDVVMDLFGITPSLKRENRQYWGRELGMCWQLIVTAVCKETCATYQPARRFGADEPFDLIVGKHAIDTKYRIGSGDSGTLKKFKQYGPLIKKEGLEPVLIIVREDNLPAAIGACRQGGWTILQGAASFDFLGSLTGVNLYKALSDLRGSFLIDRKQVGA